MIQEGSYTNQKGANKSHFKNSKFWISFFWIFKMFPKKQGLWFVFLMIASAARSFYFYQCNIYTIDSIEPDAQDCAPVKKYKLKGRQKLKILDSIFYKWSSRTLYLNAKQRGSGWGYIRFNYLCVRFTNCSWLCQDSADGEFLPKFHPPRARPPFRLAPFSQCLRNMAI